jgi:hypothetical protein
MQIAMNSERMSAPRIFIIGLIKLMSTGDSILKFSGLKAVNVFFPLTHLLTLFVENIRLG